MDTAILIILIVTVIACIILIEEGMEKQREIEWKKKAREMYKECTGHYPEEAEAVAKRQAQEFADIVEQARLYILTDCGGSFETFACWGLIRPNEAKGFAEGCE